MKKRYAFILLLLVVLCVALLVACECKHKYSEWSVTTPATCDTAGERTRTCSKCGDTERETIPAGHTLTDVPEVPKTCEADGVLAHSHCEACGADFIDGEQKTAEELRIPCTGHDILQVNALAATCHTNGVVAHLHCARCGINYLRGEVKTDAELVIPSTHSTIEIPGEMNSCQRDGVRPHVYCYDCGANFIDDEEVSADDVRIPASHDFVKVPAVAKTCTADGRLAYEHCRICDGDFVDGEEKTQEDLRVPAGHDYGTLIENSGERPHYHCEACDKYFDEAHREITVLALPTGHTFGAWTEQVDAACYADGTKGYYTCSDPDCAGTYFDIDYRVIGTTADSLKIPAAHHYEYVIDETYHGEVCSECGSERNRVGHQMSAKPRVADGYVYWDYKCGDCGYERTMVMGPALTDLWVERDYIVGRDNGVTFHIYRGTAQGNDGHGSMNQYMISPDFNEYVAGLEALPASAFPVKKSFEFTAMEGFKKTIEITFDIERMTAYPECPIYQKGALASLGELSVIFHSNYDGYLGETTLADCTVTDDGGFAVDADLADGAKKYTVKFTYNDVSYEITFTYVDEETVALISPETELYTVTRGSYPLIRVLCTTGDEAGFTDSYRSLVEFDFLDGTSFDPDLLGEQTVTIGIGKYARRTIKIVVVDPMTVIDAKSNIVCPIGSEYLRVRVRYQDGTYGYEIITPRMILDADTYEEDNPLDLDRAGDYAISFVIRGKVFYADVTVYDPNHLTIAGISHGETDTLVWEYETDADGGLTVIKDTTGLYLHIWYDDESEAIVPMTADMLTLDPDELKAVQEGRRQLITVTVTYQGKTLQFRVRLAARTPASIDDIVVEGDYTSRLFVCGGKLYRRYMLRVNCEGEGVTYVPLTSDMLYLVTKDEAGNEQVATSPVDFAQLEVGRYSAKVRYGECEYGTTVTMIVFTEDNLSPDLTGYGIDIQYVVCGDRETVLKRLSGLSFYYRLYVRLDDYSTSMPDEEVLGFEDLTIGDLSGIDFTKPGDITIPLSFGEATYSLHLSLIPNLDLYKGKAYAVPYWSETMTIILYENGYYHIVGRWLDRVDQYECIDTVNGVLSLGTGDGLFTIAPDGKHLTPWTGTLFGEKYGLTPTLYTLEDMQVRLYTNGTVTYMDLYDDDDGEWVYSSTFLAELLSDGTLRVNGMRYAVGSDGVLTVVIEGKTLYTYTENYDASAKLEFLFNEGGRAYMQECLLDPKTGETLGVRTYVYEWRMTGDVIDFMYDGHVYMQFKVEGNVLTPIGSLFS